MGAGGDLRNMSQMLCRCRYDRCTGIKNGPEIRGHWSKVLVHGPAQRKKTTASETVHLQASKAEIGKVPIAQRGAGRGHQRTVDGGHQAAKQGGGGREAGGGSLGHCRPLSKARRIAASWSGDNLRIPDTSDNAFVCIAAFCLLQCNMALAFEGRSNRQKKRPPEPAASAQCSVIPPIRRRLSAAGQARRNRGSPPPGGR